MEIYWLGRCPYLPVWDLQERLRRRVLAGGPEALLLCEHEATLTLGRSAPPGDVLANEATLARLGIAQVRTSRGGQVTYHGPGQLVAYPVVLLQAGVLRHVLALAEAVVQVAGDLGVPSRFVREHVGVWVDARKLAAIGIHVQRRVAVHGLALNVTPDATCPFRQGLFHPCGMIGGQVTSLSEERAGRAPLTVADLVGPLSRALCLSLRRTQKPIVDESNVSLLSRIPFVE